MSTPLPPALVTFVAADQRRLQAVAYTLTGNRSDAEDLLQETLLRLVRAWDRIDGRGAAGYAATIMWRLHRRHRMTDRVLHRVPDLPSHADHVESTDTRLVLRAAVTSLPPRQRAVIALRYLCDMTEQQTADALGCSVGTVKSQCAKAFATLRTRLDAPLASDRRSPSPQPSPNTEARNA
ncbi:MAG TPA: SigE family RNA polymerase sigma factor [Segeticoccus sp.]|nr:SigE family RNA polymerase sigma factor [Segeticoccus sp.]